VEVNGSDIRYSLLVQYGKNHRRKSLCSLSHLFNKGIIQVGVPYPRLTSLKDVIAYVITHPCTNNDLKAFCEYHSRALNCFENPTRELFFLHCEPASAGPGFDPLTLRIIS